MSTQVFTATPSSQVDSLTALTGPRLQVSCANCDGRQRMGWANCRRADWQDGAAVFCLDCLHQTTFSSRDHDELSTNPTEPLDTQHQHQYSLPYLYEASENPVLKGGAACLSEGESKIAPKFRNRGVPCWHTGCSRTAYARGNVHDGPILCHLCRQSSLASNTPAILVTERPYHFVSQFTPSPASVDVDTHHNQRTALAGCHQQAPLPGISDLNIHTPPERQPALPSWVLGDGTAQTGTADFMHNLTTPDHLADATYGGLDPFFTLPHTSGLSSALTWEIFALPFLATGTFDSYGSSGVSCPLVQIPAADISGELPWENDTTVEMYLPSFEQ